MARSGEIEAVSCRWAWSTQAATVSAPPAGKTRYREMVATRSSASASPSTSSGHGSGSLRKVGVSSWRISLKNELLAQPFGLFSLLQTWSTTARSDYTLLRLLSDGRLLSAGRSRGGNWYLTPNGNETSSAIAAAAAGAGMKTLVFLQTTIFCESCVKDYPARVAASQITLTEEEQRWRTLAEEEMGGAGYCYMKLAADCTLRMGTASHHALLLREERELHESLFRRPDGIKVLFATSTLAQGMNLPSEVVIISGDSRFDPQADKMQKLEAHELLNAAGRAGRAGEGAQGFVLLVPSKVIDFDDQNNQISGHWMDLQAIFEQADQCLVIDDPLKVVLDRIHDGVTQTGTSAYLLSKLPLAVAGAKDDPAAVLLNRSFSAYRAIIAADADWLNARVASVLAARATMDLPEPDRWIEQVSGATGLSVALLRQIIERMDAGAFSGTVLEVVVALLDWLDAHPSQLLSLVRSESLEEMFGTPYKKLADDEARGKHALFWLRRLGRFGCPARRFANSRRHFSDAAPTLSSAKMLAISHRGSCPTWPSSQDCPDGCWRRGCEPRETKLRFPRSWRH